MFDERRGDGVQVLARVLVGDVARRPHLRNGNGLETRLCVRRVLKMNEGCVVASLVHQQERHVPSALFDFDLRV